jgi:ubiquinone/menaquinone biosynthesis C-methylase UbiE
MEKSPRVAWLENRVSGDPILDVGFVGEYDRSLAHHQIATVTPDSTLVGLDVKDDIADQAADEGVQGDVFALPFPDATFETVVFAEVLEHIPDAMDALTELYRVLRPDGRLLLTTPNPFGLYRYLRHYLFKRTLDPESYLGAEDHRRFFDPLSLTNLLSSVGFEVTELTFRNVSLPKRATLPDWRILRRFPFNRAGSYTCLVAVK